MFNFSSYEVRVRTQERTPAAAGLIADPVPLAENGENDGESEESEQTGAGKVLPPPVSLTRVL